MILRLKNKTFLAMDKLINDANTKNGIAECFIFEPKEAADFLREVQHDKSTFKKHISFKQMNGVDVDVRFLMQSELTQDTLYMLINRWFKKEFIISYKGIEIKITKKKVLDVPAPAPQGDDHVLTPSAIKFPVLPAPDDSSKLKGQKPAPVLPQDIILQQRMSGKCGKCGSSLHYKWGFFGADGCIKTECENYYKK